MLHNSKSHGSVSFKLVNMRVPYVFYLFRYGVLRFEVLITR